MINSLFKSKSSVVAIDFFPHQRDPVIWTGGWIKIAQAEDILGQTRILDVDARQIPDVSDDKALQKEFSRLVWDMLKARPDEVLSCIPRQSVTIRFLRLPSND